MTPELYEKWNNLWNEKKLFLFDGKDTKRKLFVIDTPPPFTSGEMHIGQAFWVCYIDAIARYMRFKGFSVLYPQGWDTHGFPIELAVEKLHGKGLPRQEFYSKCEEFAREKLDLMKRQMLGLGASFDPGREYVTMTKDYMRRVQLSLIIMNDKGMLYRGRHPVEWCSYCGTSIAREETVEKESETALNYIDFMVDGKPLTIATTRPEMLHACVALAVNPKDDRYRGLIGKAAITPIFSRKVTVIGDDSVEKEFGTGAEMVCTFGDKADVTMAYKHKLETIDAIDESGKLKNAGKFTGMPVKDARKAVIAELQAQDNLKKSEQTRHTVKVHDRCGTKIELLSSIQWFIRSKEFAGKIKELANDISWAPEFARQRLIDWSDFIEWDWNISRKRVFGTPIPFWYCAKCGHVVPPFEEDLPVDPAVDKAPAKSCEKCGSHEIVGERDTCDVWVDSSITPMVVAGWPDDMELFKRAFPATMRIQGLDIVRTWAFYTILRCWALADDKPWRQLLLHGMILDTTGKEMHKSTGNGVSPEELMTKYPVDAIRLWAALSGGIGKDKPFSYEEINFANSFIVKLTNSSKFVKGLVAGKDIPHDAPHKDLGAFDLWILDRLNTVVGEVEDAYERMNLYEAMTKLINFYWHEFCDYYIENVKYRVYSKEAKDQAGATAALYTLRHVLLSCLRLVAPVMPYTAEEINAEYSQVSLFEGGLPPHRPREPGSGYIINGVVFRSAVMDFDYTKVGAVLNDIIADVRKAKAAKRISLNKEITSINIKVPEEYYTAVLASKDEISQICKSGSVSVSKDREYSVTVDV
ncbi:MAG: valine--tRNA ligase [Candidatus Micrarchaeota archaeon]|nr:valine--tRNA ligase [Candidatus Micrarchaeota archaeon]